MPSDYLDYENNLVFPPQEIKSQDDLSEQVVEDFMYELKEFKEQSDE